MIPTPVAWALRATPWAVGWGAVESHSLGWAGSTWCRTGTADSGPCPSGLLGIFLNKRRNVREVPQSEMLPVCPPKHARFHAVAGTRLCDGLPPPPARPLPQTPTEPGPKGRAVGSRAAAMSWEGPGEHSSTQLPGGQLPVSTAQGCPRRHGRAISHCIVSDDKPGARRPNGRPAVGPRDGFSPTGN